MYKLTILIFSLLFLASISFSQEKTPRNCGSIFTQQDIDRVLTNKKMAKSHSHRNDEVHFIPIQFFLIANSDGGGRILEERVFEGICKLNEDFEGTNMQFYFNGDFIYINNDILYDLPFPNIPSGASSQFVLNRKMGYVNIFIGNSLSSGNSGFYTGGADIIFMDRSYVNDHDNILAHELGHFLSLPHTFLGWEATEYDPSTSTPTEVSWGNFTNDVEYVDREKNCETSGDFFCGTPADYITNWNGGCDYTGGAVDPDSVLIDPDESNLMAYYSFAGCEKYTFADDQTEAMFADYQSRTDLLSNNIAQQEPVSEDPVLLFPIDEDDVGFIDIDLQWEAVPNATYYIIEVSRLPNFFANDVYQIVNENNYTIEELDIDKKYYWKVTAFNETNQCISTSSQSIFTTVENTSNTHEENLNKQAFTLIQNPIETQQTQLLINASQEGIFNLSIFNYNGQVLRNIKNLPLFSGPNVAKLNLTLSSGIYFIKIQGEGQGQILKLVVI